MKIMLQGYLHNANFGDMLAACLFYDRCQKNKFEAVDFYQYKNLGIGSFCRKQIGYTREMNVFSCYSADALIIISGGSFWNTKEWVNDAETRFKRFVLPAMIYQLLGKPVYVLGVGGGPVETLWLRKLMVRMLNRAKVVTFRNEQTKKIFSDYGVKNKMTVTADTILALERGMLEPFDEKEKLEFAAQRRKKLLLHLPDGAKENSYVVDYIVPALIRFLMEHKEYYPVLSNDNIRKIGRDEVEMLQKIRASLTDAGIEYYDYHYHDCWQMCSLLAEMDCVVTSKLHVGVVASVLDKCVISFPVHREKTDYFYQTIGEYDRCVNVRNLSADIAYKQICKYHDKPVHISEELRQKAEMNLAVLDDIAAKQ